MLELTSGGPKPINRAQLDEIRREWAFNRFDEVCELKGVEPEQLPGQSDDTLVQWVRDAAPPDGKNERPDIRLIRSDLAAYVRECRLNPT